jgi:DNA-binding response OmpR family regulator
MVMIVRQDESSGWKRASSSRLNLLLSCAERGTDPAVEQLPRLLAPMGIHSLRATSGEGAADLISHHPIHIAVVDLTIPLVPFAPARAGGDRILQLLRRLEEPPPTVVIRPRQAVARESTRSLVAALREGAFAVLDRPIDLEMILEVMRRILRRHYADEWPQS